jgi:hypothetical protein
VTERRPDVSALPDKPRPEVRDHIRTVGDAMVAAIPVAGGPAQILIEGLLRPSYSKRLDEWLNTVADVIRALERRVGDIDSHPLEEDELFVSAVMRATQIALGTHLEAKIELLKCALISIATREVQDDFIALRCLSFVDELAPEHFVLLQYCANPAEWLDPTGTQKGRACTPRSLIGSAPLPLDDSLVDLLLFDLSSRRLIEVGGLGTAVLGNAASEPFTTELGELLLGFVSAF